MNADLLQGFYLGDWLVEPLRGRVSGRDGSAHLPSKAVEVLLCLAKQPGELVTREVILGQVWGDDLGSHEALSHAVSEIRHALGDHHSNPKFVQTLPRRGYRLLVTPVPAEESTASVVLGAKEGAHAADLGFLENLKRRGVLETAIAYLIVGWLLIQVADIVFAQLLLPQWAGTFVTVLVMAGFPIALALSWFLEFRHGRAVVDRLSPADARRRRFSRTYVSVVSALGIAAVIVFFYDQSIGLPEADVAEAEAPPVAHALPPVRDNSIAVLPFFNIDGGEETQIFANGLADDVITRLSRIPGLLVSSRGDSFTLEPNSASNKVRERLRVAMYVEGSVQMLGGQIRVIVQLIDSETGFHVLSRKFDRPRDDFFDIRDEITELTVANVRVALPPEAQKASTLESHDPSLDVYLLYRRGVEASHRPFNLDTVAAALGWFDEALAIDPEYGAALAGKCAILVRGYSLSHDATFIARAESACSRALELNPNLDVVHTALGKLYATTGRYEAAEAAHLRALEINPTNVGSLIELGFNYLQQQRLPEAEELLTRAIGLQPGDWNAYNNLGAFYFGTGRYREAAAQYEIVVELDRSNAVGRSNLGAARMLSGDFAGAAEAYEAALQIEARPTTYSNLGLMHYYLGDLDAAIANHRKAVELAPKSYLRLSNLGDALWIADRRDEALAVFRQAEELAVAALDVNPNDTSIQMGLAWIRAMLGEHQGARELIERARSLAQDDPYADYLDALIWLRTDDVDEALAALERAVDAGYSQILLAADPHLERLRQSPRFNQLLADARVL